MAGVSHRNIADRRGPRWKERMLVQKGYRGPVEVVTARDFHLHQANLSDEAYARGIPDGGVRPLDIIQRNWVDQRPDPFFDLVGSFLTAGALGIATGGQSLMEIFDFDTDYSTLEAINDYQGALDIEDAVSVIENIEAGGSGYLDYAALENTIAISEGAGAGAMHVGGGWLDWAQDLGRKSVERFIEGEIREEFGPGLRQGPTVPVYRNLPQENRAPSGGLASLLYGGGQTRASGGYSSAGGMRTPSAGAAASGGGISPLFLIGAVAVVMVLIFGLTIFRR